MTFISSMAFGAGQSADPPRLIDLRWGDTDATKITLVGKGRLLFDTGGSRSSSPPPACC